MFQNKMMMLIFFTVIAYMLLMQSGVLKSFHTAKHASYLPMAAAMGAADAFVEAEKYMETMPPIPMTFMQRFNALPEDLQDKIRKYALFDELQQYIETKNAKPPTKGMHY